MKTFLTIAGSDPSGGAGIQADIKTASALGLYAMSAVTAVTVQNTMGVSDVYPIPSHIVEAQIDAVMSDMAPDAVKIGMCVSSDTIRVIAKCLDRHPAPFVVLDPILMSSSGRKLLSDAAANDMCSRLFARVSLITPNIPEAEYLTGARITDTAAAAAAAQRLRESCGCAVLVKGGHLNGCDVLADDDVTLFPHELIDNPNTHGTGCTLSSAVAAYMTRGGSLREAVRNAVGYIVGAIGAGLNLGHGSGPLDHFWNTCDRQSSSSDLNS